jgi:hypothetical protein
MTLNPITLLTITSRKNPLIVFLKLFTPTLLFERSKYLRKSIFFQYIFGDIPQQDNSF